MRVDNDLTRLTSIHPSAHQPASPTRSPAMAWAACGVRAGVAVCGASFYWALGGAAGLDTVGGAIKELGRSRDPAGVALGLGSGVLKVAGALLALALVRPWDRAIPLGCWLAPPGPPARC